MKKTENSRVTFWIIAVLSVLFVSLSVLFFVALYQLDKAEEDNAKSISDGDAEIAGGDVFAENKRLGRALSSAEEARDELESKIDALNGEIKNLSGGDSGKIALLQKELDGLKTALNEKNVEIEALKNDIRAASKLANVNLNECYGIISSIEELIKNAPKNVDTQSVITEHGVPVTDENGEVVYETVESDPVISLYYYDLTRGYNYTFSGETAFPSAGIENLLLSYSLCSLRAEEEEQNESKTVAERTSIYDFSREYVYTADDYVAGNGIIRENGEGKKYTHKELISLMLTNADGVAYKVLSNIYGTKEAFSLATSLGMKTDKKSVKVNAESVGALLENIYYFTETDDEYAALIKDSMIKSVHSVLSGYSVTSGTPAHFCAWNDTVYGDALIVYGKRPYILVILTDMVSGGDEVNGLISSVVGEIEKLHASFGE